MITPTYRNFWNMRSFNAADDILEHKHHIQLTPDLRVAVFADFLKLRRTFQDGASVFGQVNYTASS